MPRNEITECDPSRAHALLRPTIVVAAAAALALAAGAAALLLPMREWLALALARVEGLEEGAAFVLPFVYIVTAVLLLPSSVLTLGSGFLFGTPVGSVVALAGNGIGALAAYAIARTLVRRKVLAFIETRPRLRALNEAVSKDSVKIVALTRLSPLTPFPVCNYLYGACGVNVARYLAGTLLGMLPGTVLFVFVGSTLRSLAETAEAGAGGLAALAFLVAAALASVFLAGGAYLFRRRAARQA